MELPAGLMASATLMICGGSVLLMGRGDRRAYA
jgi:hypothetical protein